MNPIDIIANAIHAADPDLNLSTSRLAKVAVAALAPLLDEVDDDKTRDDGDPFNAGWHAAVAEIRERLGLAS